MTAVTADNFRPLGNRLLVQRYALPEESAGGIYVLGRDFPTLGRIIRLGSRNSLHPDFHPNEEVQWSIRADFQRRIVGPDLLCLEADDINLRVDHRGIAHAVGNRVLVSPLLDDGLLSHLSPIIVGQFHLTKWSLGQVMSVGRKAKTEGLAATQRVIYNPSFRSEFRMNGRDYYVVRDEDCIALLEEDNA